MHKKKGYTITELCNTFEISRETYYRYFRNTTTTNQEKAKQAFNTAVKITIFEIYRNSGTKKKGMYGSRKIRDVINTYTINGKKVKLSRHQVLRIMKEMQLRSKYNIKSYKPYPNKKLAKRFFPNLLEQNFDCYGPFEVLTSDLTYVRTADGWRYICFIIDLFNREIVGYSISEYHDTQCVLTALNSMKINLSKVRIFHTDRGGEFASYELEKYMSEHAIKQSMSKAGCPFDNAVCESMFKLLKIEGIDRNYKNDMELIEDVNTWINWYNNVRVHSKLGYTSPAIYREAYELKVG